MAKGINNAAVPMGAVIASRQVHDTIINSTRTGVEFFHGYTYSAHPLAVAAGLATQHTIREEGLYEHVRQLAPLFEDAMHSLRGEPYVTDVRNLGLAGGMTLAPHPDGPGQRASELFIKAFENGVSIRANGDTIAIAPILTSSPADIEEIFDLVRFSLRALN
jgi:beta-alanine--pyruvate transaminase